MTVALRCLVSQWTFVVLRVYIYICVLANRQRSQQANHHPSFEDKHICFNSWWLYVSGPLRFDSAQSTFRMSQDIKTMRGKMRRPKPCENILAS